MSIHRISLPEVKLKTLCMEVLGASAVAGEIAPDIRLRDKLRSNRRPLRRRSHCEVGGVAVIMFREGIQRSCKNRAVGLLSLTRVVLLVELTCLLRLRASQAGKLFSSNGD